MSGSSSTGDEPQRQLELTLRQFAGMLYEGFEHTPELSSGSEDDVLPGRAEREHYLRRAERDGPYQGNKGKGKDDKDKGKGGRDKGKDGGHAEGGTRPEGSKPKGKDGHGDGGEGSKAKGDKGNKDI